MNVLTKHTIRAELKQIAKDLLVSKKTLRENSSNGKSVAKEQWDVMKLKIHYRHLHVGYCLSRGRKMEAIESNVHVSNRLSEKSLALVMERIQQMDKENNEKFPPVSSRT